MSSNCLEKVTGLAKLPSICGNFSQLPMVPHLQELLNGTKVAEFCKRADIAEIGRDAEMLMKVLSADKEGSKFYYVSLSLHELSQDYCAFPFILGL